jgi:hypothetical protein
MARQAKPVYREGMNKSVIGIVGITAMMGMYAGYQLVKTTPVQSLPPEEILRRPEMTHYVREFFMPPAKKEVREVREAFAVPRKSTEEKKSRSSRHLGLTGNVSAEKEEATAGLKIGF